MVTRGHFITIKIFPRLQPWGKGKGTGAAVPRCPPLAPLMQTLANWDMGYGRPTVATAGLL